jgi:hypothetical protein
MCSTGKWGAEFSEFFFFVAAHAPGFRLWSHDLRHDQGQKNGLSEEEETLRRRKGGRGGRSGCEGGCYSSKSVNELNAWPDLATKTQVARSADGKRRRRKGFRRRMTCLSVFNNHPSRDAAADRPRRHAWNTVEGSTTPQKVPR